MIDKTYGRRGKGVWSSYSDVVSGSPSEECPQDVYDFAFSSQDSAHCHWSDEPGQLTISCSRKVGDCGDIDGALWKRKKLEVIGADSEPYRSSSSQESKDYGVLEISHGDFQKSKIKKIDSDPYEYNSSQVLEEFEILPQRNANSVYDFSENEDFRGSRKKNVESYLYGLNSSQELGELEISELRKCQGNRDSWEFNGIPGKSKTSDRKENAGFQKKKNKNKKKMKAKELGVGDLVLTTTTLMETQEYGEMMKHVDEVNFALDGLKKAQQVKIRRASLLALLSICGTAQQRRLLRVHGMAKTIIDTVLGLNFDDPPSNLAAAALVYLLTSDGQDDRLLDSPSCICFLIKLLKPLKSSSAKEKVPTIGSKLLGMCRNFGLLQDSTKGPDSSSAAIMHKVQDILVSCKEMKPNDTDNSMGKPKLDPKWISLLTMEKASLSTISIEDASGAMRKMGRDFKEKLRKFGGLDAVFEVARTCHSIMEEWLGKSPSFTIDLKDNSGLESLVVLLKCLKIMENTTFLSKDNQCHLLGMKGKFDNQRAPHSFTELILSVIKILSGVSSLRSSLNSFQDEKMDCFSEGNGHFGGCCDMTDSEKSLSMCPCDQSLISLQPGSQSSLESPRVFADSLMLKMRVESSKAVSCSGTSGNSDSIVYISSNSSKLDTDLGKQQLTRTNLGMEDCQDPFAFDEDDCELSKWDLLSGIVEKPRAKNNWGAISENKDFDQSILVFSQPESSNIEVHNSQDASCSFTGDEEKSNLLDECLLTAVKVLMNLANDNPEGCQQIARGGGLEILSSLIAGHFPSFSLSPPHFDDVRESTLLSESSPRINQRSSTHLTDQELDFLVAILGLLVNLVEKDGCNRSRLASVTVSLPSTSGLDLKGQWEVISLLCSIFLANHGAGEAAGEDKCFSWEDEDSMLQGAKEAEEMIVEAYAALLLAFLSTESKTTRKAIAECLPNQNLAILVPVLERFVEFHLTLNMISSETHTAVLEVIESCRIT